MARRVSLSPASEPQSQTEALPMKMRNWITGLVLLLSMSIPLRAQQTAHADLIDAKGQKIGTATLEQTPNGVEISLSAAQLSAGRSRIPYSFRGQVRRPRLQNGRPTLQSRRQEARLEEPRWSAQRRSFESHGGCGRYREGNGYRQKRHARRRTELSISPRWHCAGDPRRPGR